MRKRRKIEPDQSILAIDKDSLDEEWVEQPVRYFKYARLLAKAKRRHEERKTRRDICYAECDQDIRKDPEGYGLEKVTEASIKAAVLEHPQYHEALEALNQAKYDMDVLEAAVQALDHRKKALENLVYLHGQSYFASPHELLSKEGRDELRKKKLSERTRISVPKKGRK